MSTGSPRDKVFVLVVRETRLYGREVEENWRCTHGPAVDGKWEFEVDVRPGRGRGSSPIYKESDVPPEAVPDVVHDRIDELLEGALQP